MRERGIIYHPPKEKGKKREIFRGLGAEGPDDPKNEAVPKNKNPLSYGWREAKFWGAARGLKKSPRGEKNRRCPRSKKTPPQESKKVPRWGKGWQVGVGGWGWNRV